jgi:NTE family protein
MARGFAHIGVLRAFEEAGVRPSIIAGTSMGAVVGGAYLAGQLDALEEWAKGLTTLGLVRQMDWSFTSGLIGGRKLTTLMLDAIGTTRFEDLDRPFVCVAADLLSGHEVWLRGGKMVRAMRASFSLPGAFKPVRIDGRWLVDGALVNPIPVSVCHALGADIVIAVNVNADLIGRKHVQYPEGGASGLAAALERADHEKAGRRGVISTVQRVFGSTTEAPTMFRVMAASLNILLDRVARSRLAGDPADVNVIPKLGHIGLMEFHLAGEIIDEGYRAAQRAFERVGDAVSIFRDVEAGRLEAES